MGKENGSEINAGEILGAENDEQEIEVPEVEGKSESSIQIKRKRRERRQKLKVEVKNPVEDGLSEQAKKFHEFYIETFSELPEMRVTIKKRSLKSGRYEYVPNSQGVVFTPNSEDFEDLVYRINDVYGWGDYQVILKADKKYKLKPYQFSFAIGQPQEKEQPQFSQQMPDFRAYQPEAPMADNLAELLANQKNDADKQTIAMMFQMMKEAKGENAGLMQKMFEMLVDKQKTPPPPPLPQTDSVQQLATLLAAITPLIKMNQPQIPQVAPQVMASPAQVVDPISTMKSTMEIMATMMGFMNSLKKGEVPDMSQAVEEQKGLKDRFLDTAVGALGKFMDKVATNAGDVALPFLMQQASRPTTPQIAAPLEPRQVVPQKSKTDDRQEKIRLAQEKMAIVFDKMINMLNDENSENEKIVEYVEKSLPKPVLAKMKADSSENLVTSLIESAKSQDMELNSEKVSDFVACLKGEKQAEIPEQPQPQPEGEE